MHYEFKSQALLVVDSSVNGRTLTNNGGVYALDGGRNTMLLENGDDATIPNENWSTFNDLTISGWFKTSGFVNGDKLLEFQFTETSTAIVPTAFFNTTTNMIAWYKFEDDYNSSSGNIRVLTASGTFTFDTDAKIGLKSVNQANTNSTSYLTNTDVNIATSTANQSFSIAFWIKLTTLSGTTNYRIINFGNEIALGKAVFITWNGSGIRFTFITNNLDITYSSSDFLNKWVHICATYSATSDTMKLYKDGTFISQRQSGVIPTVASGHFRIGYSSEQGPTYSFIGRVDDVRIYNREITGQEIADLYNITTTQTNTITKSIKIYRNVNDLTFQIDNTVVYESAYNLNNTWTHILWNIKGNSPFVRINNGNKYEFSDPILSSASYTNKLGNITNTGGLYVSDFRILTIPITSTLENELYSPTPSYATLVDDAYVQNAISTLSISSDWADITNKPDITNYWTTSGNNIYNNISGNVGIGTSTDLTYKLHVQGSSVFSDRVGIGSTQVGWSRLRIHEPDADTGSYCTFTNALTTSDNGGSMVGINEDTDLVIANLEPQKNMIFGITQGVAGNPDYKMVIAPNGNVMMGGYTTPTEVLHLYKGQNNVRVAIRFTDLFTGAGDSRGCMIGKLGDHDLFFANYQAGKDIHFSNSSGTNGVILERMRIKSSGAVGIGTSDPKSHLHLHVPSTASTVLITMSDDTTGSATGRGCAIGKNSSDNLFIANYQAGKDIIFWNSPTTTGTITERLRILANGNVGIGNINPGTKLDVNGITKATQFMLPIDTATAIYWEGESTALGRAFVAGNYSDSAAAGDLVLRSAGNKKLILQSGSSAGALIIDENNNIGIGNTDPSYILDITNGTPEMRIGTSTLNGGILYFGNSAHGVGRNTQKSTLTTGNDVVLFTAGSDGSIGFVNGATPTERMRILPSGNVGIGISNPSTTLAIASSTYDGGADNFRYFNYGTALTQVAGGIPTDVCLITNSGIWCRGTLHASSDRRIKRDLQILDDNEALQRLLKIEPKKYKYIDEISQGTSNYVFGFEAQQVREHFPDAITLRSSIIPNIYETCEYTSNGIYYENTSNIDLSSNIPIDVISLDGTRKIYKIEEYSSNYIKLDKEIENSSNVFLYGTEVNDFHTLNKDYLFTINFCATQELYRIIEKQEERIQRLENIILGYNR